MVFTPSLFYLFFFRFFQPVFFGVVDEALGGPAYK